MQHIDLDERNVFLTRYFEVERDSYMSEVDFADSLFFASNQLPYEKAVEYYGTSAKHPGEIDADS